jgi:hypothetical protein
MRDLGDAPSNMANSQNLAPAMGDLLIRVTQRLHASSMLTFEGKYDGISNLVIFCAT